MTPSIGRTVHYMLSATDADQINRRRTDGPSIAARLLRLHWHTGAQAHLGTPVKAGDVFPMVIVAVAPPKEVDVGIVNGQVFLDGTDIFWAQSVTQVETESSDKQGCWFAPPFVPQAPSVTPQTTEANGQSAPTQDAPSPDAPPNQ